MVEFTRNESAARTYSSAEKRFTMLYVSNGSVTKGRLGKFYPLIFFNQLISVSVGIMIWYATKLSCFVGKSSSSLASGM